MQSSTASLSSCSECSTGWCVVSSTYRRTSSTTGWECPTTKWSSITLRLATLQVVTITSACLVRTGARRVLGVAPTKDGRTLPVFINVSGTQVQHTEVSKSRSNELMTDVLIRVLNRLLPGGDLHLDDVAIVTPYVAQQHRILVAVGSSRVSVNDVPCKTLLTTADRVQGNERPVVVFLAVNTAESGAGFLYDSDRLNIIRTRASNYFIVISDLKVTNNVTVPTIVARYINIIALPNYTISTFNSSFFI